MLALLLPLALAQTTDPSPPDEPVALPAEAIMPEWEVREAAAGTFDVLGAIDQAVDLRLGGDTDAARALLQRIEPEVTPAERPWYLYQRGICEELDWNPELARAFYEEAIARYEATTGAVGSAADARFRLALVLEDLGRPEEALAQMEALAKLRGLPEGDRATIELQRGISQVAAGKVGPGVRRIQAALAPLDAADPGPAPAPRPHGWLRAKARWMLAHALLDEAAALELTGGERRVVRRLVARTERIAAAEEQIIALVGLEEPEWILQSLLDLGDAYAGLADALAAAPVPRRLDPAESAVYQLEIQKKVGNVRNKAHHAYDQGVALATRLAFESPRVAVLRERRDQLAR